MAQNFDAVKELFANKPELLEQLAGIKDMNELSRRAAEIAKQHGVVCDPATINAALTHLSDEELEQLAAGRGTPMSLQCATRTPSCKDGGWKPFD